MKKYSHASSRWAANEDSLAEHGVNTALATVFNLCSYPRKKLPLKSAGVRTGASFVRLRVQHSRMKDKWLDRLTARGVPYADVDNLRPETKAVIETWLKVYGAARNAVRGFDCAVK